MAQSVVACCQKETEFLDGDHILFSKRALFHHQKTSRHTRPGTKTLSDRPKINLVQYTTRPEKREPQTESSLDWPEKGMRVGQKLNGKGPFS